MALNSYKTTFYKHYDDIYALANETENKAIDSVVNCFTEKDDIFANPILFIEGLPKALDKNKSFLEPLFHDNFDKFFFLLEKKAERLLRYILWQHGRKNQINFYCRRCAPYFTNNEV